MLDATKITLAALLTGTISLSASAGEEPHFDPKGKAPSANVVAKQEAWRKSMPFEDERDFAESKKGLIATPDYRQIMAKNGEVAWNIGAYDFLLQGKDFDSVHPSLQRQAILNMNYGLFELLPGKIYQVRGFDLANISFIKGDNGWIVFDPLTAEETAAAALKLINDTLGERPVTAVVYSHSHIDHFAGVRGVISEDDVLAGKVKLIAPDGFLQHAVSENVHAGNAMLRRSFFQYGLLLPRSPYGHVDQAIGKGTAMGTVGLIAPNVTVTEDFEELTVDGVRMIFQNTPGTEAPAEMNTYFPDWKAFWAAENVTGTIHNIYTLRGAQVRDALAWSHHINVALYEFGQEAELMFASHSWPRWGNERIQEVLRAQRDAYANLNNGVLHLANQGVTINQIHNEYEVPESLQNQWAARSYHGSVEHNSRGVINRYLGYWDANPATLVPLSPEDSAPLYVEMMGGAGPIKKKGKELIANGEYRAAIEILNKLVYAEPENTQAKDLLAEAFEQLGYQQESPSVRNSFLSAAFELRNGIPPGYVPETGPDMLRAMPTSMWLENVAIALDSTKVANDSFVLNLVVPDVDEKHVVELSNATLTHVEGYEADDPDLTLVIPRSQLLRVMIGEITLSGIAKEKPSGLTVEGDTGVLNTLESALVTFNLGFELLPGTITN